MAITVDNTFSQHRKPPEICMINGEPVLFSYVRVYEFTLDPVITYRNRAYELLEQWLASEQGKWVQTHSIAPLQWYVDESPDKFLHHFGVYARLSAADQVFWSLKWK
jgi:hypothetical protein